MIKKRILSVLFFMLIMHVSLFSQTNVKGLQQLTLENGLTVFLLEAPNDALVRVEFCTRAGFSSQNQNNAGFFKLYSRIFTAIAPQLSFSQAECRAESSNYVITTTPAKLSATLELLANTAFSPFYDDELLENELNKMKNEVAENSQSLATYINSAIDSKVFAEAPWKHDSGIYPALFKNISTPQARTILKDISDRYYTPQNSALFISGNINSQKAVVEITKTFGKFYSNFAPNQADEQEIKVAEQSQRLFILHSKDFSPELTQVVVQYTNLSQSEAQTAATIYNSVLNFRKSVSSMPELNIPGDDYIYVTSESTKASSRLIFQTLLQPPQAPGYNISTAKQIDIFLNQIKLVAAEIETHHLEIAKQLQNTTTKNQLKTTKACMEQLCQDWITKGAYKPHETNTVELKQAIQFATPFVFVIINSQDFKLNKNNFTNAGFQEITEEKASWYMQEMYREIRDKYKPKNTQLFNTTNANASDNNYFNKNYTQIKQQKLKNGINVISKQNDFSDFITILLSVKGGKINSADNNGFEEAMINLIGAMLQKNFGEHAEVTTKTDIATSSIIIECNSDDFQKICEIGSTTLLYQKLKPANADRAISGRQHKKRLENGSLTNQLMSAAMTTLFGKTDFAALFETQNEILTDITFNQIQAAFPAFLDASRYSIILCGNLPQNYKQTLENTFGLMPANKSALNKTVPQMSFPKNRSQQIKLKHTFLTDIPAEEAGPMPAVLIPTTTFSDPVLYSIQAPAAGTKDAALFNSIMNYAAKVLQAQIDSSKSLKGAQVKLQLPQHGIDAVFFTIQNVSRSKELDNAFRSTMRSIKGQIESINAEKTILPEIKDCWVMVQMEKTLSNSGTAELLQHGLELLPEANNPAYYLREYNYIQTATTQDYQNILPSLPEIPPFRLYPTGS